MLCSVLTTLYALRAQEAVQQQVERAQANSDAALLLQQQVMSFADATAPADADALRRAAAQIRLDTDNAERGRLEQAIATLIEARGRAAAPAALHAARTEAGTALLALQRAQAQGVDAQRLQAAQWARFARQVLIGSALLTVVLGLLFAVLGWRSLRANRKMMGQLDQLAHEDGLTGVLNRRALDERLAVEIARAERLGVALTVVMIDLDHFKRFNDRRGHGAGDALLRGSAQAWRRQLRPTDLIARYGGEEFTLVLPACDADQALQLIERLRPLVPDMQTFSAGVALRQDKEDADALLGRADQALLQAKRGGRNRSVVAGREPQIALPLRAA